MKKLKLLFFLLIISVVSIGSFSVNLSKAEAATCNASGTTVKFSDGGPLAEPSSVSKITDKIKLTPVLYVECDVANPTGWTVTLTGPTKQGDQISKKVIKNWTVNKWDTAIKSGTKYQNAFKLTGEMTPFTGTPAAAKYDFQLTTYNSKNAVTSTNNKFTITYGTVAPTNTPTNGSTNTCTGPGCGTTTVGDFDKSVDSLINPINVDTFPELVLFVLKGFLFLIGVMAVLIIIIGGVRMVLSQGNQESITKGKQTVIWAVAGLIVALLSFSMVSIVQNLLGQ